MNRISSKIQFLIVASILAITISSFVLFLISDTNTRRSQDIIETMTDQYNIISLSADISAKYISVAKNFGDEQVLLEYQATVEQTRNLITSLKSRVISSESQLLLIGVENTVNQVINECEAGIEDLKNDNFLTSSDRFGNSLKYNEFVRENVRTLLQTELEYLSESHAKFDKSYQRTVYASLSVYALIVIIIIFASNSYSRQLTDPLVNLSIFAKKIASGDLKAKPSTQSKNSKDEVGSLTASIQAMVDKLLEMLDLISAEKVGVEKKVQIRTKQLQDEQARLAASISALPRVFIILDKESRIISENGRLGDIFGHQDDDWSLELIDNLFGESLNLSEKVSAVLKNKKPDEIIDFQYKAKFLSAYIAPVLTAEKVLIGAILTIKDVTEAKVMARSKDEFFSIASHELRTPLTAIRGNTSMMIEYYPDSFKDPELKQMLDDTHDASVRLISIVNDFLDMSRLEMNKVEFKSTPTDIASLVNETLKSYQVMGSRKKLSLDFEKPSKNIPPILVDSDRLRQVLINLIGNGLKFTKTGGVKVSIHPQSKKISIWVSDTGEGIPSANQGLLFHKFQQAGSSLTTRDTTRGTGLGLYISRLLVEGMGGTLELIKSEVGKGSTFGITLPLKTST